MSDLSEQLSEGQTQQDGDLLIDLAAVLKIPEGRSFLRWVIGECNVYGAIYAGEGPATNFNLGERNIGLKLISKLNDLGPTTYPQLLLDAARTKPKEEPVHVVDSDEAPPDAE